MYIETRRSRTKPPTSKVNRKLNPAPTLHPTDKHSPLVIKDRGCPSETAVASSSNLKSSQSTNEKDKSPKSRQSVLCELESLYGQCGTAQERSMVAKVAQIMLNRAKHGENSPNKRFDLEQKVDCAQSKNVLQGLGELESRCKSPREREILREIVRAYIANEPPQLGKTSRDRGGEVSNIVDKQSGSSNRVQNRVTTVDASGSIARTRGINSENSSTLSLLGGLTASQLDALENQCKSPKQRLKLETLLREFACSELKKTQLETSNKNFESVENMVDALEKQCKTSEERQKLELLLCEFAYSELKGNERQHSRGNMQSFGEMVDALEKQCNTPKERQKLELLLREFACNELNEAQFDCPHENTESIERMVDALEKQCKTPEERQKLEEIMRVFICHEAEQGKSVPELNPTRGFVSRRPCTVLTESASESDIAITAPSGGDTNDCMYVPENHSDACSSSTTPVQNVSLYAYQRANLSPPRELHEAHSHAESATAAQSTSEGCSSSARRQNYVSNRFLDQHHFRDANTEPNGESSLLAIDSDTPRLFPILCARTMQAASTNSLDNNDCATRAVESSSSMPISASSGVPDHCGQHSPPISASIHNGIGVHGDRELPQTWHESSLVHHQSDPACFSGGEHCARSNESGSDFDSFESGAFSLQEDDMNVPQSGSDEEHIPSFSEQHTFPRDFVTDSSSHFSNPNDHCASSLVGATDMLDDTPSVGCLRDIDLAGTRSLRFDFEDFVDQTHHSDRSHSCARPDEILFDAPCSASSGLHAMRYQIDADTNNTDSSRMLDDAQMMRRDTYERAFDPTFAIHDADMPDESTAMNSRPIANEDRSMNQVRGFSHNAIGSSMGVCAAVENNVFNRKSKECVL